MDQYRTWSDEALDEHRRAILDEQERRTDLARLPAQIAEMATKYIGGGGHEDTLTDALQGKTGDADDVDA